MVRDGLLRRLFPGVYVDSAADDDMLMRTRALALVLPEGAVATDRTAAWLHGVDALRPADHMVPPPLDIDRLPGGTRVRKKGVDGGQRTLAPADVEDVHGVAVTTPLRTALDLGRLTPRDQAIAALDGLLRLGRFSHQELLADVERFAGRRGVVQLRELAPLADARSGSPGESALRLRWIEAGLPPVRPQVPVRVNRFGIARAYVDLGNEELRFGAEYDGWDWHSSDEQREHDRRRRKWLRDEEGWTLAVFTKSEVFADDRVLVARILRAELEKHLRRSGVSRQSVHDTPRFQGQY